MRSCINVQPPLVVHVIYRLAIGGMENGLVNLINNMPDNKYQHVIICLTEYTDFKNRIIRPDVAVYAMHKKSGNDFRLFNKLKILIKRLEPDIVHSRNLAALEYQVSAILSGVKVRIHSEHGREGKDLSGTYIKYNIIRKLFRPFIHKYIGLSKEMATWLKDTINISAHKVAQIYNGVDTQKFKRIEINKNRLFPNGFVENDDFLIGTVGRLAPVKNQMLLINAFECLLDNTGNNQKLKLAIVGDGSQYDELSEYVRKKSLEDKVWLAGEKNNTNEYMNAFDVFVLPSLGEGISNTILEAMSCSTPVVATDVGGNSELVVPEKTGKLVTTAQPQEMAEVLEAYFNNQELAKEHGRNGRSRIENEFSMEKMVQDYMNIYDELLSKNINSGKGT